NGRPTQAGMDKEPRRDHGSGLPTRLLAGLSDRASCRNRTGKDVCRRFPVAGNTLDEQPRRPPTDTLSVPLTLWNVDTCSKNAGKWKQVSTVNAIERVTNDRGQTPMRKNEPRYDFAQIATTRLEPGATRGLVPRHHRCRLAVEESAPGVRGNPTRR